jgi:hypothetical protein
VDSLSAIFSFRRSRDLVGFVFLEDGGSKGRAKMGFEAVLNAEFHPSKQFSQNNKPGMMIS